MQMLRSVLYQHNLRLAATEPDTTWNSSAV